MGLIPCPNCGTPVSADQGGCQNCGANSRTGEVPDPIKISTVREARPSQEAILVAVLDDDRSGDSPSRYGAPRQVTFTDDGLYLERNGPMTAPDLLKYDKEGRVTWRSEELRRWVVGLEAANRPVSSAGLVLVLVGIIVPFVWIAGVVLCVLAVRQGRREQRPHGTAVAGLWIAAVLLTITLVVALIATPW